MFTLLVKINIHQYFRLQTQSTLQLKSKAEGVY